jgi:hypothetical protein
MFPRTHLGFIHEQLDILRVKPHKALIYFHLRILHDSQRKIATTSNSAIRFRCQFYELPEPT